MCMRGTSVLNIDCNWLNERVCMKCPLVRAVTAKCHLSMNWVMWGLQLDTWAQDAVWCGPLVTELPALKSLKWIPELWNILTSNTPIFYLIFMVENKDVSAHHWQAISECPINEWINASYVALNVDDITLPTLADNTVEVVPFPTALVLITNHDDVWRSEETSSVPKDIVCNDMDPAPGAVITGSRPSVTATSCCAGHAHRSHLAWSAVDDSIRQAVTETMAPESAPKWPWNVGTN